MKTPLPPQPSPELPDCSYTAPSSLIRPSSPTPTGTLYLSNLDDQHFLRFSIKYLYLFETSVPSDTLKRSLSRVLIDYYPLAGRLRTSCPGDDRKLEVDCNGEGALFAEASMDLTAEEVLGLARRPNRSWRKLLYRVEGQSFLNVPPLVVQFDEVYMLRTAGSSEGWALKGRQLNLGPLLVLVSRILAPVARNSRAHELNRSRISPNRLIRVELII
ncbi:hypothetical protein CRG98_029973 [Punica granatum]|uniref:Uncharacterized protein n=1 Tax=Punica granatum TaxID=22663 RepID=A0A2I0J1Q3_PUNGR|nr:hypothetical protein CRG98_029973 [Punica granatum]